jgi:hypothetical protein
MYLETTWILMTDVVNIVFLTDVVNKLFEYWIYRCCECEMWILVMLCEYSCVYIIVNSEFEKYTCFIANLNNIFNLYRI